MCASLSQHQPFGPLSRKELQSFQLDYPIAGVWPRPLLMASAAPAAAAKVRTESIVGEFAQS